MELWTASARKPGGTPASITPSIVLHVAYDHPEATRDAVEQAVAGGFRHFVLALDPPYREGVARWVAGEPIDKRGRGRGPQGLLHNTAF